ncbi:FHA domain-containing protein [Streptomyces capparidis]
MKLFAKLFGRSRQSAEGRTARHRVQDQGQQGQGPGVPGMRGAPEDTADAQGRPLFREGPGGHSGGGGVGSVDPAGAGRIGFGEPSTTGGGFASDPYATQAGQRQEAESMPVCTRCGHRNPQAGRFCSNCGAPMRAAGPGAERPSETTSTISISGLEAYDSEGQVLPPLSPEAQAAVDALPAGSALLIVRRGPNSGSRFLLDSEVTTAGRHPESDIFLDDVTVSRRHVEFRRTPEGFTVTDVGSLNGTYVNRERIDSVALHNGDEVQIGKYRLVFHASHWGV